LIENEFCPRRGAIAQIAVQKTQRFPTLPVLDLKTVCEADAMVAGAQSIAQLDIFHGMMGRVEPAHIQEYLAPNRAASTPESRRRGGAMLVHVVMEKVLELREEIFFARFVVIRTDQPGEIFILGKNRGDLADAIQRDHHVGIHEQEHVACCFSCTEISSAGRSAVAVVAQNADWLRKSRAPGAVAFAIRHDDQLILFPERGHDRRETGCEMFAAAINRNDNRDAQWPEALVRQKRGGEIHESREAAVSCAQDCRSCVT